MRQLRDPYANSHALQSVIENLPLALIALRPNGRVYANNISTFVGHSSSDCFWNEKRFDLLVALLPIENSEKIRLCHDINCTVLGNGVCSHKLDNAETKRPCRLKVRTALWSPTETIVLISLQLSRRSSAYPSSKQDSINDLKIQEDERKRIARELHDETAQQLASIQIYLDLIRQYNPQDNIYELLLQIDSALAASQRQIRTLSFSLHPPEIGNRGISETLHNFCRGFARRANIALAYEDSTCLIDCSPELAMTLYRILQEALTNVSKHAEATKVQVRLRHTGADVVLEVEDDGVGIPHRMSGESYSEDAGIGLLSMRERVEALGGAFSIIRRDGTLVSVSLPMD